MAGVTTCVTTVCLKKNSLIPESQINYLDYALASVERCHAHESLVLARVSSLIPSLSQRWQYDVRFEGNGRSAGGRALSARILLRILWNS